MSCSADNPEILGPIYDGDEVIIGVTTTTISPNSNPTLSYLCVTPSSVKGNENTYIKSCSFDNVFDPNALPRYKIHFLSPDPLGSDNPYVFFTLNNAKTIKANCPQQFSGLSCESGITNINPAGLGVTTYPEETISGYPESESPKASFLYPGAPAPIQLVPADGTTTSWFPLTNKPRQPRNANYVLALSNVPYFMNSILEGNPVKKVNTIAALGNTIKCTPNRNTESGCETQYYIIPTKFFESNSARIKKSTEADLCKNCELTMGPSAILGALCSIGCNPNINAGQFCCSGKCKSEQLDCTKVCKYGFTDEKDCLDNCFYDYCRAGRQCGGDCKSSCAKQGDICMLDKNDEYKCVPLSLPRSEVAGVGGEDPGTHSEDKGLITTEIVGIAILALFLIGFVIFVIREWAKAYNEPI